MKRFGLLFIGSLLASTLSFADINFCPCLPNPITPFVFVGKVLLEDNTYLLLEDATDMLLES